MNKEIEINIEVLHTMLFKYTETMAEVGTEDFDILLENNLAPLKELKREIRNLELDIKHLQSYNSLYDDYDAPTHGGFSGADKDY